MMAFLNRFKKAGVILSTPKSSIPTELRSFQGIAGYHSQITRSFPLIRALLHAMTSRRVYRNRVESNKPVSEQLNDAMTHPCILSLLAIKAFCRRERSFLT